MRASAGEWVDRYRYHLTAGALAAGLTLSPAGRGVAAICVAVCAGLLGVVSRARITVVCVLVLAAGVAVGELRLRAIDAPAERLEPYASVDASAMLLERPRPSGRRTTAAVRLTSGDADGAKLLATVDGRWRGPAEPGTELRVQGLAKPPRQAEGSHFDWPAHLRRRGIHHELHLTHVKTTAGRRGGITGAIDSARRRAEQGIDSSLPPDKAALLRGMVLGQDEAIHPLTRDDWRDSGLAHLLAVSGQNVVLLCALALPLLALTGAAPATRVAVLLALIALYVPLAGAGPSIQRAAVMGGAGLVAIAVSRPASAAYALLLAAVATLLANPRISGDPGWQLSFAAVAGILAGRPFAPRGALAGAVWLTVVASVATIPLLALHFQTVPLASVPANVAALPAVAPVMWAGMAQTALAQAAVAGTPGQAVASGSAQVIALLAEPLLAWLGLVAARTSELPHAVAAVGLRGAPGVVASYAALAGAGWAAIRVARRAAPYASAARSLVRLESKRTLALAAAGTLAAVLIVAEPFVLPTAPERLTVTFLDVGQGDATLIQHPDGSAVLFDGGPAAARVARLLAHAGVRRLSAVVATHASADHHGGLAEVLDRFPVGLLLDGGDGTADRDFQRVIAEAHARSVPVATARAGQVLRAGGLAIRVLSPPPRQPGPPPEDPNPRAVVAVVSSGRFDLLLSADAESPTLAGLPLREVEAMKVPHHGSADPGLAHVLTAMRPEVAVIPVGENSYGHPHPDTLRALARAVPYVRRTDRDGTVRLEVTGDGMALE